MTDIKCSICEEIIKAGEITCKNCDKISLDKFKTEQITFLNLEYTKMWEYYIITLENKKNLFEWYFKIVAIPGSFFGLSTIYNDKITISDSSYAIVFLTILISGIGLFISYCKESGNGISYLKAVDDIRSFYKKSGLNNFLSLNLFKELSGDELPSLNSITFFRVVPLIIINSLLLLSFSHFALNSYLCDWKLIGIYILSFIVHSFTYPKLVESGKRKIKREDN